MSAQLYMWMLWVIVIHGDSMGHSYTWGWYGAQHYIREIIKMQVGIVYHIQFYQLQPYLFLIPGPPTTSTHHYIYPPTTSTHITTTHPTHYFYPHNYNTSYPPLLLLLLHRPQELLLPTNNMAPQVLNTIITTAILWLPR